MDFPLFFVFLLSTVGFLMDFHIDSLDGKVSILQSYHIKSYSSVCYKSRILIILDIFGLSNI